MAIRKFATHRLVKSEDLNHHGTLFAGRTAEWFVESGFVAAANLLNPKNLVCFKIHGMLFTKAVSAGTIVCFESCIIHSGRSSIKAYVKVTRANDNDTLVDGFLTFVHVDENGKSMPHGLNIVAETAEDKAIQEIAAGLDKK